MQALNPYPTSHHDDVAGVAQGTFRRANLPRDDDDAGTPRVQHRKSPWLELLLVQVAGRGVAVVVAAAEEEQWTLQLADESHHHRLHPHLLRQCVLSWRQLGFSRWARADDRRHNPSTRPWLPFRDLFQALAAT